MSGFTIPNKAVLFPFQSRIFASDIDILAAAVGGRTGVIASGCAVAQHSPVGMAVDIAAGQVVVQNATVAVSLQTVNLVDSDVLLPRFDTIVVFDDGVAVALEGTPDAAPVPLSPPADAASVGQVFIPASAASVTNANIVDKRVFVPSPLEATEWIQLSVTADVQRTNTGALADDPILKIPVSANGIYRVKWFVPFLMSELAEGHSGGVMWDWRLPGGANATWVNGVRYTVGALSTVLSWQHMAGTIWTQGRFGEVTDSFAGDPVKGAEVGGEMVLKVGPSTTGLMTFRWCQQNAQVTATLTRRAGAYVEYQVV